MTGAHGGGAPLGVRHLYVHMPFCVHRCGYCDFVTVVGRQADHAAYVDALLRELDRERACLAPELDTVFVGGGTPTYTEPAALEQLLHALPPAAEVTVEANPESVTPRLARLLRAGGVTRVSLGAQTFDAELLRVLERRATPDAVRRAFADLRDAGFDNVSIDLLYGIPGQTPAGLAGDLAEAIALAPEHLSCYELEAKAGTRFTHAWGEALARQADDMEGYLELVVDTLQGAGYRWYETSSFCLADGVDRRACHNLAYWHGRDYLGVGVGAVSTVDGVRWRNRPGIRAYAAAAAAGGIPPRDLEPLDARTRLQERLMLGLRLDEPLALAELDAVVDRQALERLRRLGLVEERRSGLRLTARGRCLGDAVTVALLAESPANEALVHR